MLLNRVSKNINTGETIAQKVEQNADGYTIFQKDSNGSYTKTKFTQVTDGEYTYYKHGRRIGIDVRLNGTVKRVVSTTEKEKDGFKVIESIENDGYYRMEKVDKSTGRLEFIKEIYSNGHYRITEITYDKEQPVENVSASYDHTDHTINPNDLDARNSGDTFDITYPGQVNADGTKTSGKIIKVKVSKNDDTGVYKKEFLNSKDEVLSEHTITASTENDKPKISVSSKITDLDTKNTTTITHDSNSLNNLESSDGPTKTTNLASNPQIVPAVNPESNAVPAKTTDSNSSNTSTQNPDNSTKQLVNTSDQASPNSLGQLGLSIDIDSNVPVDMEDFNPPSNDEFNFDMSKPTKGSSGETETVRQPYGDYFEQTKTTEKTPEGDIDTYYTETFTEDGEKISTQIERITPKTNTLIIDKGDAGSLKLIDYKLTENQTGLLSEKIEKTTNGNETIVTKTETLLTKDSIITKKISSDGSFLYEKNDRRGFPIYKKEVLTEQTPSGDTKRVTTEMKLDSNNNPILTKFSDDKTYVVNEKFDSNGDFVRQEIDGKNITILRSTPVNDEGVMEVTETDGRGNLLSKSKMQRGIQIYREERNSDGSLVSKEKWNSNGELTYQETRNSAGQPLIYIYDEISADDPAANLSSDSSAEMKFESGAANPVFSGSSSANSGGFVSALESDTIGAISGASAGADTIDTSGALSAGIKVGVGTDIKFEGVAGTGTGADTIGIGGTGADIKFEGAAANPVFSGSSSANSGGFVSALESDTIGAISGASAGADTIDTSGALSAGIKVGVGTDIKFEGVAGTGTGADTIGIGGTGADIKFEGAAGTIGIGGTGADTIGIGGTGADIKFEGAAANPVFSGSSSANSGDAGAATGADLPGDPGAGATPGAAPIPDVDSNSGNETLTGKRIEINIGNNAPGTDITISTKKSDSVDSGDEESKSTNREAMLSDLSKKDRTRLEEQAKEDYGVKNLNELEFDDFEDLVNQIKD